MDEWKKGRASPYVGLPEMCRKWCATDIILWGTLIDLRVQIDLLIDHEQREAGVEDEGHDQGDNQGDADSHSVPKPDS